MGTAGKLIRARRAALGWSQETLARRCNLSQAAIKKIEDGTTQKSRYLPLIAQELELDLSDLDPSLRNVTPRKTFARREKLTGKSVTDLPSMSAVGHNLLGDLDLPVFGVAMGGSGALVLDVSPFSLISRPHNLLNVADAFGVQIIGSSMDREYREGDIAYVNPHLPPRAGDACLFQSALDGETQACVKYLEKPPETSDSVWHVSQSNPRKIFTLDRRLWQRCFVLVGKQTGR